MKYVLVKDTCVDDYLADDIFTSKGFLIAKKNTPLTQKLQRLLQLNDIDAVYIADEDGEDDKQQLVSGEEKRKIIQSLKNLDIASAIDSTKAIVDKIKNSDEFLAYFDIKTIDNYTYEHSISVSVYATLMGFACNFKEQEIINLAISGMLHDIGKFSVPQEILFKPGKLTPEEFDEIKKHPLYGYNMLKDNTMVSSTIKYTIFAHHENEDGSGYPRGLKSNEIYKFAKIIHIVDVFDALISKRPYKEPMPMNEAIQYIKDNIGHMFDKKYAEIFCNIMPSYAIGDIVFLNTGEKAVVIDNSTEFHPIVKTNDDRIIYITGTDVSIRRVSRIS